MRLMDLVQQLRHLVLEHPEATFDQVEMTPHGQCHSCGIALHHQPYPIATIHLNVKGTKVILEAKK